MGLRIQVLTTKLWMNTTGVLNGKGCFWQGPSPAAWVVLKDHFLSPSSCCNNEVRL